MGQQGGEPLEEGFRIGLLSDLDNFSDGAPWLEALKQGLRDLGYVEGQNVWLEQRNAQSNPTLLTQFAAELVKLNVKVIVVASTTAATAAKQATQTIPIIFWATDPVSSGLVPNLDQSSTNLTGVTQGPEQQAQWLTLLKEMVPGLRRVKVAHLSAPSPVCLSAPG